jgi:recombination protein RecR
MPDFAAPLQRLIDELRRLPGIGQKSAQRLAFHVLRTSRDNAANLANALLDVKDNLGICAECNNISDAELCPYCRDPNRDRTKICIVEEPHNLLPIETTRTFDGLYHVLGGAISPLRGIGPEQLKIKSLLDRISQGGASGGGSQVEEIILATNPNVEGEATAVYLSRLLKPLGMRVTRIAMGIPVGSDLEFSDEVTISKSLENRREM